MGLPRLKLHGRDMQAEKPYAVKHMLPTCWCHTSAQQHTVLQACQDTQAHLFTQLEVLVLHVRPEGAMVMVGNI